jgi:uncharacterized phage protein (TIGR01671 family)
MTRQIKFRAKRTDRGAWMYGYYAEITFRNALNMIVIKHIIIDCQKEGLYEEEVIGDTVGQFSGRHDKNGKDIYEGDICSLITENGVKINVVCRFGSAHKLLASGWLCDIVGFYFQRDDGLKSFPIVYNYKGVHDTEIMEVIGNIHDNPDLLPIK